MKTYLIEIQIDSLKREREYLIERKRELFMVMLRSAINQFDDEIRQYTLMIKALENILNEETLESNSICTCTNFPMSRLRNGKFYCSECDNVIVQIQERT